MSEFAAQAHDQWEELAAGHALDALEPEETQVFLRHLAGCPTCKDVLADHEFVAAQLGTLVEDHEDAPSWDSIRSGVVPAAQVTSLEDVRNRRRNPWLLSAAASVVLIGGASALAWQTTHNDSQNRQQQAISACTQQSSCHVIQLQGKATLLVADGSARLLASSLSSPTNGHVYVLWQLPRTGRPTMVGTLQNTRNGEVGEAHPLALPYQETTAFGLSLESSASVPTGPTALVALGSA